MRPKKCLCLSFSPKKTIGNPYPVCSSFIRKDLKNNIKINIFLMEKKNMNMRNPFCTRNGRGSLLLSHDTQKLFLFSFVFINTTFASAHIRSTTEFFVVQECLSLFRNRSDLRYL